MTASGNPGPSRNAKHEPSGPSWRAWVQAARLPSQMYIFWPLLLGQSLAMRDGFSWEIVILCHLYGLASQLYIVFANDVADVETDRENVTYTMFSGGSRVLVQGLLPRSRLVRAAACCALISVLAGLALGLRHQHWLPLPLIVFGLVLLWAYSYPPIRLSYRGGGEFLQMIGVGLVLPLIGYSAHAGNVEGLPWTLLPLLLALSLSCAMATALPDEPSDRIADKRTHAVRAGVSGSQRVILAMNAMALGWLLLAPLPGTTSLSRLAVALPCLVLWICCFRHFGAKPGAPGMLAFVSAQVAFSLTPMVGLTLFFLCT